MPKIEQTMLARRLRAYLGVSPTYRAWAPPELAAAINRALDVIEYDAAPIEIEPDNHMAGIWLG